MDLRPTSNAASPAMAGIGNPRTERRAHSPSLAEDTQISFSAPNEVGCEPDTPWQPEKKRDTFAGAYFSSEIVTNEMHSWALALPPIFPTDSVFSPNLVFRNIPLHPFATNLSFGVPFPFFILAKAKDSPPQAVLFYFYFAVVPTNITANPFVILGQTNGTIACDIPSNKMSELFPQWGNR